MWILKPDRKLKISDDFVKVIIENSIGNFSKEEYDDLFKIFNKELGKHYFTRNSESNLIRIFTSIFNKVIILSPTGDLHEAGTKLFSSLYKLDKAGLDVIYAEKVPLKGSGHAIMDRLKKGAVS